MNLIKLFGLPRVILLTTGIFFTGVNLSAQTARPTQVSPNQVNGQLLAALKTYQNDASVTRLEELRSKAAERQQVLTALMASDPGAVLASALPDDLRSGMPDEVRTLVEQHVSVTGELEVAIEDAPKTALMHYAVRTAGQRLELHFADHAPRNLVTGMTVQVDGVQVGEALATNSTSTSTTTSTTSNTSSASVLPNTFGAQKTLVILVNFQDNTTQPWTPQDVQSTVFGTASNFLMENSFQQTWLTGDVTNWFTLPLTVGTTCPTTTIQSDANTAAQNAGYNLSNYTHVMYVFPSIPCGWAGYAIIGGAPGYSWINGELDQLTVDHEIGHNLGLYHSHSLSCGSVVYASSGCTLYEYGDYWETMGNSNVSGNGYHYNAFQKERLGWLNNASQPPITTVTSNGTYTIGPYEAQDATPKALKILQSAASNTYYYVEFRQPLGFDNWLSQPYTGNSEVMTGVLVHIASPSDSGSSDLLDMNPSLTWGVDMALVAGQTYTDSAAGVTIAVNSVSSTGATVQVTMAQPTCTAANPTVSMTSPSSSVAPGATATFAVNVTDNDSSGCGSATFNLSSILPSGWSSAYSANSITLAAGGSGSLTLAVTAPTGTADGTYQVESQASNSAVPSDTSTGTGTETIYSQPAATLSVSTNSPSYTAGRTVSISVTDLSGAAAIAGANVKVMLTKTNGSTVKLSGTTGSNGVAVVSYKVRNSDPKGTWGVAANASSASATTSFTVQ